VEWNSPTSSAPVTRAPTRTWRMEFPTDLADAWLDAHPDATGLSYGYVIFAVRKPVATAT
jgi:hypothetical protein